MGNKTQAVETHNKKKDNSRVSAGKQEARLKAQTKAMEVAVPEAIDASLVAPALSAQSNPLADTRMPAAHRQALAGQIGQIGGNQLLQRVVASLSEPAVQRRAPAQTGLAAQPLAGTIQREDGDEEAVEGPANNLATLDEMLDRFNVPEDEVIDLLGQLSGNDKAEVINPRNGYKAKIADALNEEEMARALANLNPPLTTKLDWMSAAAGGAASLDYADIQPMITAAPDEASTLAGWQNFFVEVCNNETIMTAVQDLGFPLVTQLDWIRAEVFSARLELDYGSLSGLITAATQIDRDALKTNSWRDFFVEVCNNETMQQAVVDLGWEPATKLEWLLTEGVNIEETIETEITGLGETERNEVLANTTVMDYLRSNMNPVEFWHVQLILTYGDEASIPDPAVTVYDYLSAGPDSDGLRAELRDMPQADLDTLKTMVGLQDVLRAVLSAEDANFVIRLIETGVIAEQTGVTRSLAENLLVPNAAGTNYVERPFGGTGGFDVAYHRDRLQVTVRINLSPMNPTAAAQLPAAQPVWETNIENAWNVFNITNDERTIPMRFDCVFTSSNPHHTVTVHPNNPVGWPSVDMTNWWTGSLGSPSHEFGHMLGNPDEYFLSSEHFAVATGQTVAEAQAAGTLSSQTLGSTTRYSSTGSIMGFSGSVQPRHLQYFLDWLNQNRMQNTDGTFAESEFRLSP